VELAVLSAPAAADVTEVRGLSADQARHEKDINVRRSKSCFIFPPGTNSLQRQLIEPGLCRGAQNTKRWYGKLG
jgi:hypothetical protein